MKKMLKEYFSFSKKERIAIAILLAIIITSIVLPYFLFKKHNKTIVSQSFVDSIINIQQQKVKSKSTTNYTNEQNDGFNTEAAIIVELFYFDPNTIDADGWRKLGLREKTIQTILNYTSKGGRFKTAEDIRKIWGLKKEEANRLIPYIRIAPTQTYVYEKRKTTEYNNKILLDINTATPQQFKQIPNIGFSIPYKIVNYRDKLGGFLQMQQIREVREMTDSLFNSITPYLYISAIAIKKVNINTASEFQLSSHPYIEKSLAKAIIIQREKYGSFKSVNDIKQKIIFLTDEVYHKIEPYLTINEE